MTHDEYLQQVRLLSQFAQSYYADGIELVPNHTYDLLYRQIEEFEVANPDKISPISPTRKAGAESPSNDVRHSKPLLSLKNALSMEELYEQVEKWLDELGLDEIDLIAEPKYDGCAANLTYAAGQLTSGATRGDGEVGEDFTRNIYHTDVQKRINIDGIVEIRGEMMINKADLDNINGSLKVGEKAYQNTRNAIAGLLRRKPLAPELGKFVKFYPYEIVGDRFDAMDRVEKINALSTAFLPSGIDVTYSRQDSNTIFSFIEKFRKIIPTLPYEVDGVVIKINNQKYCDQLGTRLKTPRWAVAYKYPPEEVETMLLGAVWQVGRTGEVAPVARVAPVLVGGTIVVGPTMHNQVIIQTNDWRIGDTVRVYRAGAVVPALGTVVLDKRPANATPIEIPTHCPCCDSELVRNGPSLFCLNRSGCSDQLVFEYDYIFSRKVLDISDISDKTIRQIVDLGKVHCAADFFDLTPNDLAGLIGYSLDGIRKLIHSFKEGSREKPLNRVIQALCIPDVGESTSKQLAAAFGSLQAFFEASDEQLLKVPEVGTTTVANIRKCFEDKVWLENARKLGEKLEIMRVEIASVIMKENVTDKIFVITGAFPETRDQMRSTLELFGAIVRDSVSKNTDYLVVGDEPSPGKLRDAQKRPSISVLNYEAYQSLLA